MLTPKGELPNPIEVTLAGTPCHPGWPPNPNEVTLAGTPRGATLDPNAPTPICAAAGKHIAAATNPNMSERPRFAALIPAPFLIRTSCRPGGCEYSSILRPGTVPGRESAQTGFRSGNYEAILASPIRFQTALAPSNPIRIAPTHSP